VKKIPYIIGIDEAGRGPLAGPVAVGVVLIKNDFAWHEELPGVTDSKKLSANKRLQIFKKAVTLKRAKIIDYQVSMVLANEIDKIGIVPAINQALNQGLTKLVSNQKLVADNVSIKLDGGLKAPAIYKNQETIIKGDSKELVIGLASILAKVTRDQYMDKIADEEDYKIYNFAKHMGYGTKEHRQAISNNGISKEHRVSFCQNVLNSKKP
jgi:ribonuclease HII